MHEPNTCTHSRRENWDNTSTSASLFPAGGLPSIYFSDDPRADLVAYIGSYLQQEIVAEGATRNISAFSRFLKVAAY